MLGWEAVREVDWGRLFHAYGIAEDTPEQLHNLTSPDQKRRAGALQHLTSAVVHQGTIYSVTPVVVRVLAGIMDDPALRQPCKDGGPVLAAVLAFLGYVAESLDNNGWAETAEPGPPPTEAELAELFEALRDDEDGDAWNWGSDWIGELVRQALLDLRAMAGEVLTAILPYLTDVDAEVRRQALAAVARWGMVQPDSAPSAAAVRILADRLQQVKERDERAGLVLSLGQLGGEVVAYLDDSDAAVRACAALFVASPRADALLIAALTDPERVDRWFEAIPAFFPMLVRFTLLSRLIERGVTVEAMLPAALALIASSSGALFADQEWKRILQAAFPDQVAAFKPGRRPPLPERITPAQRAIVEALTANPALWKPGDGNTGLARMKVGLPNDRAEVIAWLRVVPG